jgi:hypothetical protein
MVGCLPVLVRFAVRQVVCGTGPYAGVVSAAASRAGSGRRSEPPHPPRFPVRPASDLGDDSRPRGVPAPARRLSGFRPRRDRLPAIAGPGGPLHQRLSPHHPARGPSCAWSAPTLRTLGLPSMPAPGAGSTSTRPTNCWSTPTTSPWLGAATTAMSHRSEAYSSAPAIGPAHHDRLGRCPAAGRMNFSVAPTASTCWSMRQPRAARTFVRSSAGLAAPSWALTINDPNTSDTPNAAKQMYLAILAERRGGDPRDIFFETISIPLRLSIFSSDTNPHSPGAAEKGKTDKPAGHQA